MDAGAYGVSLGSRFGLDEAPVIVSRALTNASIAVTELRSDRPRIGKTESIPPEDAFLVALQLRDYPHHQYWEDGKQASIGDLKRGDTVLYDLKRDPVVYIDRPFHSMHFYITRQVFDAIAERENSRRIDDLHYMPGAGVVDPVVNALGTSLYAAFERPNEVGTIFLDHVSLAVAAHIAQTYGGLKPGSQDGRSTLAAWQERKAKEMLSAHLDGSIEVSDLAAACKLSPSHFARAFRQTIGMAPHQWLLQRRVDVAKSMMRSSDRSLSEVALACGFADQSHFTRVFSRLTGESSGTWRRTIPAN